MALQQSNITSTSTPTSTPEPMPPPRRTTATGMTKSNANPTVSTPAPVLTDAVPKMCRYCSGGNSYTQRSKINLYARSSEKDIEGGHTGNLQVPLQLGYH